MVQVKLVRSPGLFLPIGPGGPDAPREGEEGYISPEDLAARWSTVTDFSEPEDADINDFRDTPQLRQVLAAVDRDAAEVHNVAKNSDKR